MVISGSIGEWHFPRTILASPCRVHLLFKFFWVSEEGKKWVHWNAITTHDVWMNLRSFQIPLYSLFERTCSRKRQQSQRDNEARHKVNIIVEANLGSRNKGFQSLYDNSYCHKTLMNTPGTHSCDPSLIFKHFKSPLFSYIGEPKNAFQSTPSLYLPNPKTMVMHRQERAKSARRKGSAQNGARRGKSMCFQFHVWFGAQFWLEGSTGRTVGSRALLFDWWSFPWQIGVLKTGVK